MALINTSSNQFNWSLLDYRSLLIQCQEVDAFHIFASSGPYILDFQTEILLKRREEHEHYLQFDFVGVQHIHFNIPTNQVKEHASRATYICIYLSTQYNPPSSMPIDIFQNRTIWSFHCSHYTYLSTYCLKTLAIRLAY